MKCLSPNRPNTSKKGPGKASRALATVYGAIVGQALKGAPTTIMTRAHHRKMVSSRRETGTQKCGFGGPKAVTKSSNRGLMDTPHVLASSSSSAILFVRGAELGPQVVGPSKAVQEVKDCTKGKTLLRAFAKALGADAWNRESCPLEKCCMEGVRHSCEGPHKQRTKVAAPRPTEQVSQQPPPPTPENEGIMNPTGLPQ